MADQTLQELVAQIVEAVGQAADAQRRAAALLDQASVHASALQELTKPPTPAVKGWGPGPKSGLPWHSGCRCQNDGAVDAFVRAVRPGKPIDVIMCFTGPAQAETWDDVAGGKDDGLDAFDGVLSFTRGQGGSDMVWRNHPDLDAVLSLRPIPEAEDNKDGKNPRVWQRIAGGELNWAYRRIGRKLAGLDAKYPRTGRLVLEIGHEFTGDWYAHSILGAVQWFSGAWAKIVSSIREGYRSAANKDCPHLFLLRPARSRVKSGEWTEAWLPDPEFWDIIGISQHDNGWSPCTPKDPRINWRRQNNAEGLDNIAEIADRHDRLIGISEWSSHNPSSSRDQGPHPDIFTRSMWDWFSKPGIAERLAFETYFLSSASTPVGFPTWSGATSYKKLWGG